MFRTAMRRSIFFWQFYRIDSLGKVSIKQRKGVGRCLNTMMGGHSGGRHQGWQASDLVCNPENIPIPAMYCRFRPSLFSVWRSLAQCTSASVACSAFASSAFVRSSVLRSLRLFHAYPLSGCYLKSRHARRYTLATALTIAVSVRRAASMISFLKRRSIAADAPGRADVDSLPQLETLKHSVRTQARATLQSAMSTNAATLVATAGLICGAPAARSNTLALSSQGMAFLMGSSRSAFLSALPLWPTRLKCGTVCGGAAVAVTHCAQFWLVRLLSCLRHGRHAGYPPPPPPHCGPALLLPPPLLKSLHSSLVRLPPHCRVALDALSTLVSKRRRRAPVRRPCLPRRRNPPPPTSPVPPPYLLPSSPPPSSLPPPSLGARGSTELVLRVLAVLSAGCDVVSSACPFPAASSSARCPPPRLALERRLPAPRPPYRSNPRFCRTLVASPALALSRSRPPFPLPLWCWPPQPPSSHLPQPPSLHARASPPPTLS